MHQQRYLFLYRRKTRLCVIFTSVYCVTSRYTSVSFCICNASICSSINVTVCCRRVLRWLCNNSSFWLDSANCAASLWLSWSNASLACTENKKKKFNIKMKNLWTSLLLNGKTVANTFEVIVGCRKNDQTSLNQMFWHKEE